MRAATSDTASLLRNIPGVSTYGAGGVSSLPVIRGLADDRIRITGRWHGSDRLLPQPHESAAVLYRPDQCRHAQGLLRDHAGQRRRRQHRRHDHRRDARAPVFAAPGQDYLATGQIGGFYRSNGNAWGANIAATAATENISLTYTGSSAQADNYKAGGNFKTTTATGRVGHTLPLDEVGSTAYETSEPDAELRAERRRPSRRGQVRLPAHSRTTLSEPAHGHARQRSEDHSTCAISASTTGDMFEARAYYEKVDPHYMDFGPDKRFWYGVQSGGRWRATAQPCSPISANCAAGMPMYTKSSNTGVNVKADVESRRAEPAPRRRPLSALHPRRLVAAFRRRHVARHLRQHQRRHSAIASGCSANGSRASTRNG